jgi:hypothetical protein
MLIKQNGVNIELYDGIQSLPIKRFQKFNKYLMMSIDIGNSFEDYDSKLRKARQFVASEMYSDALQELENQRQTVMNSYNEFFPTGFAFAVLVKKIGEKEYNDISPTGLQLVIDKLDEIGYEVGEVFKKASEVKKK